MASMNWLGFSLSPQAHQEMSADQSSFGMLEDFHRDNQSQDWMGMNSMILGTTACNQQPKLENFLDSNHSLGDASSYNNGGDNYLQLPFNSTTDFTNPRTSTSTITSIDQSNNNGINVSMIKTWLRNQPASENKNEGGTLTSSTAAQTLSLSMTSGGENKDSTLQGNEISKQQEDAQSGAIVAVPVARKSVDTFGQRTSIYRGVTRHRWTGRYEAHLWDNSSRREGQTRKGRQVYLGGYDKEDKAARSYDLAAVKYWGATTTTNFPISNYEKEIEEMQNMTRQEYVASLRRKSSGFSRGASIYRGVTRHHQHGRWQARIGRVAGNKDLYLGTFSTQEEAAEAYDIAAIKFRGLNAVTNIEINRYDVKAILESSSLPIGGSGKRMKEIEELTGSDRQRSATEKNSFGMSSSQLITNGYHSGWPAIAFQQAQPLNVHYPYSQQPRLLPWFKQENQDSGTSNNLQDFHQLHQGNNSSHNSFLQPASYSLMGMDGSLESNSVMYGNQMSELGENNLYYQQGNESWIPTAVPTLAPRTNNGAQIFTVWNDA